MAKIMECDICGSHYKVRHNLKLSIQYDGGERSRKEWDLCDDCCYELMNYLDKRKEKKNV